MCGMPNLVRVTVASYFKGVTTAPPPLPMPPLGVCGRLEFPQPKSTKALATTAAWAPPRRARSSWLIVFIVTLSNRKPSF